MGQLFGVYEQNTQILMVKDSIELNIENMSQYQHDEGTQNILSGGHIQDQHYYRQVGFYIISEELQQYNHQLLHYLVNNHSMKFPNVFFHINPYRLKENRTAIHVYKMKEKLDEAFDGFKLEDKLFYKINNEKLLEFIAQKEDFFIEMNYQVQLNPICKYLLEKHRNCFSEEQFSFKINEGMDDI